MIEQVLKLVRENSQELIVENPAIPDEKNDFAIFLIGECFLQGIREIGANPARITDLTHGVEDSGIVQQMIGSTTHRVATELHIPQETIHPIVSKLLPKVMASFGTKLIDPLNKEFTMGALIRQLTGMQVPTEITSMLEKLISPEIQPTNSPRA